MRTGDAILTKRVKSEFIRRELDTSRLEVKVMHGIAYLGGELKASRHRKVLDAKKEMAMMETIILGVRDVRGIDNRIKWVEL